MSVKGKVRKTIWKKTVAYVLLVCMLCSGISFGHLESVKAAATTVVYFLNSKDWSDVGVYAYVGEQSLSGTWNSKKAEKAQEIGDRWYKFSVSAEPQFSIIFYNRASEMERAELAISDKKHVYVALDSKAYTSKNEAEKSVGFNGEDKEEDSDSETTGGNTEKNPDVTDMTFSGKGANLPYITYEAEAAATNATVLKKSTTYRTDIQSEASGRQAVKLEKNGDYVEFTLQKEADTMVLRYCIPDSSDGKGLNEDLSLYVNGTEKQNVALTSAYAWIYGDYPYNNTPSDGKAHRFFDEVRLTFDSTLSAGSKIKLQKDASDKASYYIVDFIECEKREAKKSQPSGSLSVTDYGAKANDNKDDYEAFVNCMTAAKNQNKEVWIPAGTFHLNEERALDVNGITIRGAGMWYTNLVGAGVSFRIRGTCKFHDFAMTGVSKIRDDGGDLAGFEPVGGTVHKNVTIENIWMEHIKVGIWSYSTQNLLVQGCRIRNTYADGMNMCSDSHYATIRNNNVRNTGDDGIAIWPWTGDCTNNLIAHNTVQLPNLANGIALYAGNGNRVENNHVLDIVNNGSGICLGSEFDTQQGFSGTTTVSSNCLERCGSYQTDRNYPVGALWIWSTWHDMTANYQIIGNEILNSSYVAFLLDCNARISGVNVSDLIIDGATDAVYVHDPKAEFQGAETGEATFSNVRVRNYTGKLMNNELGKNFTIKETNGGIHEVEKFGTVMDLPLFSIEGEAAQLSEGVKVSETLYAGISNGTYLGYLGGKSNESATFHIYANTEGYRWLNIYYATESLRKLGIQINDMPIIEVECPKTGGWQTLGAEPAKVAVKLVQGKNIIKLTGANGGDAPNIDRIEIGLSEEEAKATVQEMIDNLSAEETMTEGLEARISAIQMAYNSFNNRADIEIEKLQKATEAVPDFVVEAGAAEFSGGAGVSASLDTNSSGGYFAQNIGGKEEGTATFSISSDTASVRRMKVFYITDETREVSITVNDAEPVVVKAFDSDSWIKPCNIPLVVMVDLKEGENKIAFAGVKRADGTTGYAPNIDRIAISMTGEEQKATVEDMIADLPKEISGSDREKAKVYAADRAYESLAEAVKITVAGAEILKSAVEQVNGTGIITPGENPSGLPDLSAPSEPTDSSGSTTPSEPTDSSGSTMPSEPNNPTTPSDATVPDVPGTSDVPTTPGEASAPSAPVNPVTPSEPRVPSTPEVPGISSEPMNPGISTVPLNPSVPMKPETPTEPNAPSEPSSSSEPVAPVKPPIKVKISSAKSNKANTITIKWKKVSKVNGYQVQYATNKKFKKAKSLNIKKKFNTCTIKKLVQGKKYYVRVCSCKIVQKNGESTKLCGKWSKVKIVKVKG